MTKRYSRIVKLMIGLHHKNLKVVKFLMELHHGSSKRDEANVQALLYRLLHPYKPMNGRYYKRK